MSFLRLSQTALSVRAVARAAACGVSALTASSASSVHGLSGFAPPVRSRVECDRRIAREAMAALENCAGLVGRS